MSRLSDLETTARTKVGLIASAHIAGFDIDVETYNGIVILTGVVENGEQKQLAEDIARAAGGIDIKNDLVLLSEVAQAETAPGLMQQVAEAGEGYMPEDISVRQRILGNLESDPRVNSVNINVDETAGIVHLSGIQENEEAKTRAESIAARVAGVTMVVNDIEVEEPAGRRAA